MTPVPQIQVAPGGPTFSRLVAGMMGLSSWQLRTREALDWLHACLDLGISTFDHADIYGGYTCEGVFGQALAEEPSLREQMQLVTKCGIKLLSPNRPSHTIKHYDTSRQHILASVENSLRELHTDYVDLLLIHRPDPLLDADEVAGVFYELRRAGKVRHFGVSNFKPWQYDLLASRLDFPLVTNQVEFSVLNMEVLGDGTLDQCQRLRISPMAWAPFGGGDLFTGNAPRPTRVREALRTVGEARGVTVDQVALAWILTHPSRVLAILGTGKIERLRSAAEAADMRLSREEWFAIWSASQGHEVP